MVALSRTKKLPKLERLYVKPQQKRRQDWREQMVIMDRWSALTRRRAALEAART